MSAMFAHLTGAAGDMGFAGACWESSRSNTAKRLEAEQLLSEEEELCGKRFMG